MGGGGGGGGGIWPFLIIGGDLSPSMSMVVMALVPDDLEVFIHSKSTQSYRLTL